MNLCQNVCLDHLWVRFSKLQGHHALFLFFPKPSLYFVPITGFTIKFVATFSPNVLLLPFFLYHIHVLVRYLNNSNHVSCKFHQVHWLVFQIQGITGPAIFICRKSQSLFRQQGQHCFVTINGPTFFLTNLVFVIPHDAQVDFLIIVQFYVKTDVGFTSPVILFFLYNN